MQCNDKRIFVPINKKSPYLTLIEGSDIGLLKFYCWQNSLILLFVLLWFSSCPAFFREVGNFTFQLNIMLKKLSPIASLVSL